ncbi:MAG TPA: hypothetical protein VG737_13345, partial [Cyclobacteriaceae bacterium]|nr:hypothetical protein [Cyclobacteriaceae bacterium]
PLIFVATMRFSGPGLRLLTVFFFLASGVFAQDKQDGEKKEERISLLAYVRVIRNANGTFRVDENLVPNFRLNRLLRLELGFRQGQTSGSLGAYNHYKVELQTKYFYKTFRIIARLSDRIVRYPVPYSNSNYLMVAESRFPVGKSFSILAAAGYVYTFQEDNTLEGWPIAGGTSDHFPTYKLALRYDLNGKGFAEIVLGAYDVFNPYPVDAPFLQGTFDRRISNRCTLYSYFRYQFHQSLDMTLNEFLSAGVRIRLAD